MTEAKTAPEVPHADLIALGEAAWAKADIYSLDGAQTRAYKKVYLRAFEDAADVLAALGDTVPREQYDHDVSAWRRQLGQQADSTREEIERADSAERERDEALALHDAEVWRQAAAFVDVQREDFDGDLRQVRDRMRDRAAAIREEAK